MFTCIWKVREGLLRNVFRPSDFDICLAVTYLFLSRMAKWGHNVGPAGSPQKEYGGTCISWRRTSYTQDPILQVCLGRNHSEIEELM